MNFVVSGVVQIVFGSTLTGLQLRSGLGRGSASSLMVCKTCFTHSVAAVFAGLEWTFEWFSAESTVDAC